MYLEQCGLTEDQIKGLLKSKIGELVKQEQVLAETIKKMGDEVTAYHEKRKVAAQAYDRERVEIENLRKKLADERTDLQKFQQEIGKENLRTTRLRDKLNEDKEIFRNERIIFNDKAKALEEDLKDVSSKKKEVLKELEAVADAKCEVYLKQRELSDAQKEVDSFLKLLETDRVVLNDEMEKAKTLNSDLISEKASYAEMKDKAEKSISIAKKKYDDLISAFESEKEAIQNGFRQREVDISRKEKQVEIDLRALKAKREQVEIIEARIMKKESEFQPQELPVEPKKKKGK